MDLVNATSWLQFIILLVSVITVGIKVGRFTGKQEQININQDKKNTEMEDKIKCLDEEMGGIKNDITTIRIDVGEIKTVLKMPAK
jgi:archaellum component FlaC